jgi:membrane protein DedA with SNARE-associated domain
MLESLVTNYGYPMVVVGTFFEGETILILGGLVAHLGYLTLGWVILSGLCGSLLGNQVWFFIGRRYGSRLLARYPAWRTRVELVLRRLERRRNVVILGFPFVYGFRVVTPVAIGMSTVPYWRFLLLNVVSVSVWAACIACAGYYFGRAVEAVLGDVRRYEVALISSVVAAAVLLWLVRLYRRRQARRGAGTV